MHLSYPQSSVVPSLDGEVLLVLSRTSRPLSGRQISRMVHRGSWSGIYRALQRLTEQGIVTEQEAAPAILYTLNRDHVAAPAVEVLSNLHNELERRVRDAIAAWTVYPVHASIFGSAARRDGGTESDVDIFVVRPTGVSYEDERWRDQVDGLADAVYRWSGNRAGIAEVSQAELDRLRRKDPMIVREVRRDAVTVAGSSADDFFGDAG